MLDLCHLSYMMEEKLVDVSSILEAEPSPEVLSAVKLGLVLMVLSEMLLLCFLREQSCISESLSLEM